MSLTFVSSDPLHMPIFLKGPSGEAGSNISEM
jgi:hypothetical protein